MTKRKVLTLCLAAALAAGFLGTATPTANADPAIVVKPAGPCGMPGADADGNLIVGGIGEASMVIENGNKVTLKCQGKGITNLSGRAQSFKGFPCGIILPDGSFVLTTDSHGTISASGVSTLTCTFKKP